MAKHHALSEGKTRLCSRVMVKAAPKVGKGWM